MASAEPTADAPTEEAARRAGAAGLIGAGARRSRETSQVARPQGQRCKAGACHLELQDAVAGEAHVLRLSGELDLGSAAELEAAIVSICGSAPRAVSLDLRGLIFIDSSGLHAIISARDRCAQLGCDFRLIPGPPAVQRLFELTGMLDELPFARTADAANANS